MRLAETIEKQVELRRKIKSAMTYPVVVFILVLLIASGMLIFIVPQFKTMYADLGGKLPALTSYLVSLSDAVRTFFPFFVRSQTPCVHQCTKKTSAGGGRRPAGR